MDLTLSGEFAKQIFTMTKKDGKLAEALARQFLASIEPTALARYLLSTDVAAALLADRIREAPEQTYRQLLALSGQPAARVGKVAAPPRAARTRGARKRHRLTAQEITRIKQQVRSFLGAHPWSNRRQIGAAVAFPSLAAYNRIMTELRASGEILCQGDRSKTIYANKGAKGPGKAAPAKATPAKATPAKPGKRTAPAAKAKAKVAKKTATTKAVKKAAPRLCPVPGCKNKAAPVFGMVCRDHKDLPKAERDKLFAARRAAK